VILVGRVSRSMEAWNERVSLAEALDAKVINELKLGAGVTTDHPLHDGRPLGPRSGRSQAQGGGAQRDVILSPTGPISPALQGAYSQTDSPRPR